MRLTYIGLLLQIITMAIIAYFAFEAGADDEGVLAALRGNTVAIDKRANTRNRSYVRKLVDA